MVRGKAYKQTKDESNGSIYFPVKSSQRETSFMTVSKSTVQNVLHGSANAAGTQSKTGELFAVIFQRVRHLCCEKQRTFSFSQRIFGKGGNYRHPRSR